ncbi:glyoxalase, partial [Mycobacterium sp. ITM-2017-0098]
MTVAPIPAGYTSLTPFLCVDGAAAAIDFYTSVFGAIVVEKMDGPDGTVAHAELDFGSGRVQLGDPAEAYKIAAPDGGADVVT